MKLSAKAWTKDLEKGIYEEWKSSGRYAFVDDARPMFSIDTPPPYVNTPIHIGHAATYTLMDMFARFNRMMGRKVLFPLGLDRNGLPIEVAAEKRFGVSIFDVSREEFISLCKKLLEESSADSIDSFLKLGISFNSWKVGEGKGDVYFTDSKEYRILTQDTFIEFYNRGLVYEDDRINNYCPGCRTTLADAEVDYDERPTAFNDVAFTVKETGKKIVIGTTRPELICTCAMVIYNPADERYRSLEGKHAVTPIFNKTVPIKAHPIADMEKGTGLMMMCAFGDQNDIRFFREMNITPAIAIDESGRMNANAGILKGLTVKDARAKIIDELKKQDLLEGQKKIMHRTPICERSKDEIEFIAMKELYLKQVEFKGELRKMCDSIKFYSPKSRQILLDWIDSVSIDWPLSRRRYYATEVPLWYCSSCGRVIVPEKGHYYQPWRESPPVKACPNCGSSAFKGETRVFDTWFDSAGSPLYILQYSRDGEFFRENFPCSLRPQGKEIVRTWLYYTLLKIYLLTRKPAFSDVWIHYHIVDENGMKMSKSVGNVINPHEIIEKCGAEPFRLWCAVEGNLEKDDMRCSYERIEGAAKTITKLWNVASFVAQFEPISANNNNSPFLEELDKWIIKEMDVLIRLASERYAEYDFHNPAIQARHFLWETFASHYLELVKNRAYNQSGKFSETEQKSAVYTLNYCLSNLLKILSPITPFVTQHLYREIYKSDVDGEPFPKEAKVDTLVEKDDLFGLNNTVWKAKKDKGLSLKAGLKLLVMPEKFAAMEKDIAATHGAERIEYGNEIKVEFD